MIRSLKIYLKDFSKKNFTICTLKTTQTCQKLPRYFIISLTTNIHQDQSGRVFFYKRECVGFV